MNRRYFLRNVSFAGMGTFMLGNVPINALAGNAGLKQIARAASNDKILVLIQMHGGNDGLNSIIPINQYSTYYNLRPNIAIPIDGSRKLINLDTTLPIDAQAGVHPDMLAFKRMYDDGLASVVMNVGYDNMNLSHFRGRDIMFMGGGSGDYFNSGWMGRLMDYEYPGYPDAYPNSNMPDPIALEIGNTVSLAFHRENSIPIGFSIDSPEAFYNLINGIGAAPPIAFPDSHAGEELKYLMEFEKKSDQYSTRLKDVYNAGSNTASVVYPETYPLNAPANSVKNPLSGQLKLIARLLKGGCKTRIFLCRIGGFDTHASQVEKYDTTMGTHAALMYHISASMKAFYDDLKGLGYDDKVLAMTFTEFGRRAYSNASYGTDHGTAFPIFLFAKGLKSGILGANPNLSDLDNGNFKYAVDYRQVYTSVVQDWFAANDAALKATYFDAWKDKKLPLFTWSSAATDVKDTSQTDLINCHPNPAKGVVLFTFFLHKSGKVRLTLYDVNGKMVAELLNEYRYFGSTDVPFDVSGMPSGVYIYKLETEGFKASKRLLVK